MTKDDIKIKKVYKEVYMIIEHSEEEIKNKISKKFVDFLYNIMDKEYEPNIDYSKDIINQNLMPDTLAIIALIYRDFILDKETQKSILKKENIERDRIEEEKRKKYSIENIFEDNSPNYINTYNSYTESVNERLPELKKESIFEVILNKIKMFLLNKN